MIEEFESYIDFAGGPIQSLIGEAEDFILEFH